MAIFYLIFAYLLGSIPFGYLITRFSTGKNILEIGWEKTSSSNVFKNVGKWQGILTGVLDVAKGFVAVRLAQFFPLPIYLPALCGVAAICGHNWSCFLKFSGGRGIGTFLGCLLALSPEILGFSLIPLVLFFLIWNAAVGTIVFLITVIVLSFYSGHFETVGLFGLLSLPPIFIKRLSPVKELSWQKKELIKNRLIFDDNVPHLTLRIKTIVKKLTSS